ncbi:hypothetical protein GCM10027346_21180 [Hymenobacter seoulensis]
MLGLLLATGCKKEKTELERLPSATQEGKNTAGFLLDGKAWMPEASDLIGSGSATGAQWYRTIAGRTLRLGFSRASDGTSAGIFIPHITQTGNYRLQESASIGLFDNNPVYVGFQMTKSLALPRFYFTGPFATGTLVITRFDTVARVVAGTFNATVQEETGTETHELTQGRFDLRF